MNLPVWSEGPSPALGVIIGESNARYGQLFVPSHRNILRAALRIVGLDTDELHITNVVKEVCLDDENRVRRPYPDEIESWRPILALGLEACVPAAILTLGNTAGDIFGDRLQEDVYRAWHPEHVLQVPARFTKWVEQIKPFAEHIDRVRA
jgi:uracil-DNA glycosylase family 4